jgi:hypothetical protein
MIGILIGDFNMKIKVLILLSVIVLISCARKITVQEQCYAYGQQHVEYHYDVCLTENGITEYPCFMKLSLVEELIEYIGSGIGGIEWACNLPDLDSNYRKRCELFDFPKRSSEIVLNIGGGGFCERRGRFLNRHPVFCKASNPENGCDTLHVMTKEYELGGSNYTVIRVDDKWKVINAGPWIH